LSGSKITLDLIKYIRYSFKKEKKMFDTHFKEIISLTVFLFMLMDCSKKEQVVNQEIITISEDFLISEKNEENITEIIVFEKEPLKVGGFESIDDEDGRLSGKFIGKIDEIAYAENPEQYLRNLLNDYKGWFGDSIVYFKRIRVNIDETECDAWFSSHHIVDSASYQYYWLHLYVVKADVIRAYQIPFDPKHYDAYVVENYYNSKLRSFSVLRNLPGNFDRTAWLYDVNGDGFDEIIGVNDYLTENPELEFKIIGYNRNEDKFVFYLDISTAIIDVEIGPEPIQYVQNQGVWGFRCLMDSSKYTPIYPSPMAGNENFVWCFFLWDSERGKYIESKFVDE
jgi:hypothetical protein